MWSYRLNVHPCLPRRDNAGSAWLSSAAEGGPGRSSDRGWTGASVPRRPLSRSRLSAMTPRPDLVTTYISEGASGKVRPLASPVGDRGRTPASFCGRVCGGDLASGLHKGYAMDESGPVKARMTMVVFIVKRMVASSCLECARFNEAAGWWLWAKRDPQPPTVFDWVAADI
jgi:hypothetical protein